MKEQQNRDILTPNEISDYAAFHGYTKHVGDKGEFKNFRNKKQKGIVGQKELQRHALTTLKDKNTKHFHVNDKDKATVFYNEKSNTAIYYNRNQPEKSTIFRPKEGLRDINNIRSLKVEGGKFPSEVKEGGYDQAFSKEERAKAEQNFQQKTNKKEDPFDKNAGKTKEQVEAEREEKNRQIEEDNKEELKRILREIEAGLRNSSGSRGSNEGGFSKLSNYTDKNVSFSKGGDKSMDKGVAKGTNTPPPPSTDGGRGK